MGTKRLGFERLESIRLSAITDDSCPSSTRPPLSDVYAISSRHRWTNRSTYFYVSEKVASREIAGRGFPYAR